MTKQRQYSKQEVEAAVRRAIGLERGVGTQTLDRIWRIVSYALDHNPETRFALPLDAIEAVRAEYVASRPAAAPWLAYTRTGPSHKSFKTSTDHGTVDGLKTLCGYECGGDDKRVSFNPSAAFSCKRCAKKATP